MKKKHPDCQLKTGPFYQCCCTCIHLRPVHHHCCTEPKPPPKTFDRCCCGVRKSYACANPEMGRIYDNWPKHSVGCECHRTAAEEEKGNKQVRMAMDLLFRHEYPKAPFRKSELQLLKLKEWPLLKQFMERKPCKVSTQQ